LAGPGNNTGDVVPLPPHPTVSPFSFFFGWGFFPYCRPTLFDFAQTVWRFFCNTGHPPSSPPSRPNPVRPGGGLPATLLSPFSFLRTQFLMFSPLFSNLVSPLPLLLIRAVSPPFVPQPKVRSHSFRLSPPFPSGKCSFPQKDGGQKVFSGPPLPY